jgi:hypothetical protein
VIPNTVDPVSLSSLPPLARLPRSQRERGQGGEGRIGSVFTRRWCDILRTGNQEEIQEVSEMSMSVIAVLLVWIILGGMLVGAFRMGKMIERYVEKQSTDWRDFLPAKQRKKYKKQGIQ